MINLLPPEIKKEAEYSTAQKEVIVYGASLILFGIVAIGIQLLGYVFINQQRNDLKTDLDAKNAQLEDINKSQSDAVRLSADINKVGALLDRQVDFSTLIQEVGAVLPNGTRLNSLSLGVDNTQPISFQFDIDTQEKAAVVRKNLEDSNLFVGADIQNINVRETNEDGNAVSFTTSIITKFSEEFLDKGLGVTDSSEADSQEKPQDEQDNTNADFGTSSDITLNITDASGGFLFLKKNKVAVNWTIPVSVVPIFEDGASPVYTLYASQDDNPATSPNPELILLETSTGDIEFETKDETSSYKFAICISHPTNVNTGCNLASEVVGL